MKTNLLLKTAPAIVMSILIALGISACSRSDDTEKPAKISDSKMEESIDRAIDDTQEVMSDSWITTKVKSVLMADSLSKGFEVNVVTKDSVVRLEGTLDNQDAIDHVSRLASEVKGVSRVDASRLVVQQ